MTDLLPCPFCGDSVSIKRFDPLHLCVVHETFDACPIQVVDIHLANTEEEVIEIWNNRDEEPKRCCANCKHTDGDWCLIVEHQVDFRSKGCIYWRGEE